MSAASDIEARAALVHAGAMLLGIGAFWISGRLWILIAVGVVSLAEWIRRRHAAEPGSVRTGFANSVTALRIGLVAGLALFEPERMVPGAGMVVFLVFVLDGVDGWWARRTGSATAFGAAFDQEADAFLVAVASAVVVQVDAGPGWVLLAGALRYGYVLVVQVGGLHGEAPRSVVARYVFGIVVVSLTAALSWPGPVTRIAVMIAVALLVWSFARSLWWSWRGPTSGG